MKGIKALAMYVLASIHNSYLESWRIAKQLKPQSPRWKLRLSLKAFEN